MAGAVSARYGERGIISLSSLQSRQMESAVCSYSSVVAFMVFVLINL
jgi:hypothetical protein